MRPTTALLTAAGVLAVLNLPPTAGAQLVPAVPDAPQPTPKVEPPPRPARAPAPAPAPQATPEPQEQIEPPPSIVQYDENQMLVLYHDESTQLVALRAYMDRLTPYQQELARWCIDLYQRNLAQLVVDNWDNAVGVMDRFKDPNWPNSPGHMEEQKELMANLKPAELFPYLIQHRAITGRDQRQLNEMLDEYKKATDKHYEEHVGFDLPKIFRLNFVRSTGEVRSKVTQIIRAFAERASTMPLDGVQLTQAETTELRSLGAALGAMDADSITPGSSPWSLAVDFLSKIEPNQRTAILRELAGLTTPEPAKPLPEPEPEAGGAVEVTP